MSVCFVPAVVQQIKSSLWLSVLILSGNLSYWLMPNTLKIIFLKISVIVIFTKKLGKKVGQISQSTLQQNINFTLRFILFFNRLV